MMSNTKTSRNIYFAFLAVFLTAALFTGCRHDVLDADGETVSAVITPLQIGPLLLPFGEEDVTTYGLATGLATMENGSCGIFASILGSGFTGTNYGVSVGLGFGINGRESSFNGISAGLLYFADFLGYGPGSGTQNGISVFPFVINSHTNGLSVEATTQGKDFNGIDICLFNLYGTRGAGLQVIGVDCSAKNESRITGCQIGGGPAFERPRRANRGDHVQSGDRSGTGSPGFAREMSELRRYEPRFDGGLSGRRSQ